MQAIIEFNNRESNYDVTLCIRYGTLIYTERDCLNIVRSTADGNTFYLKKNNTFVSRFEHFF